jgi:3,4-dihydroxy 2-butanone 4-phosphate synthase/GTP cyclohydrolase II
MARLPDLVRFAEAHGLKIGTIADLIAYRLRHDRTVERILEAPFESLYGDGFRMLVYVNRVAFAEHLALVKGDLDGEGPVLVRMHAFNVLEDALGDTSTGKAQELRQAMEMIDRAGRGVVVFLREPYKTALSDRVRARISGEEEKAPQLRDYGVGAQILLDLGVRELILLSNTRRTIIGLQGYGLRIIGQQPIGATSVES